MIEIIFSAIMWCILIGVFLLGFYMIYKEIMNEIKEPTVDDMLVELYTAPKTTEERNIDKLAFPSVLEELRNFNTLTDIHYVIGVDTYDKRKMAYTLARRNGDVLLCKIFNNEKDFEEEVQNLAKYFNAEIYE